MEGTYRFKESETGGETQIFVIFDSPLQVWRPPTDSIITKPGALYAHHIRRLYGSNDGVIDVGVSESKSAFRIVILLVKNFGLFALLEINH